MKRTRLGLVGALSIGLVLTATAHADAAATLTTLTTVASWSLRTGGADGSGHGHTARVDPAMPGVSFSSLGAYFNEHGRLVVSPSAELSPGTRDFAFGFTMNTGSDPHANLFQAGNTHGADPFLKVEMTRKRGSNGQVLAGVPKCRITGLKGTVALRGSAPTADGRWHTIRCSRSGDLLQLQVDGATVSQRRLDVGAVNVATKPWYLGAKGGPGVGPGDAFFGTLRDAFIAIG